MKNSCTNNKNPVIQVRQLAITITIIIILGILLSYLIIKRSNDSKEAVRSIQLPASIVIKPVKSVPIDNSKFWQFNFSLNH